MKRLAALAAAFVGVAASLLVAASAAGATALPIGQCTTSSNAILAVNFGRWGGPIVRACGSTPTTGFQLLNQGGFRTTGTRSDGPAFICRISSAQFGGQPGYPSPADDTCVRTPPDTAYWSYWHANAGDTTWSYSQLGAMSYHPQAGSVDYWTFGKTNTAGTQGRPAISPDALRAHNASATGGGYSGGGGGTGGGGTGGGSGTGRGGTGGGGDIGGKHASHTGQPGGHGSANPAASRPPGSRSSPPASAASTGNRAGGTTRSAVKAAAAARGSSRPTIVDAKPASAEAKKPDTGSAYGVFLGVALAVLLAAGAGWTVLRRRRAEAAEH